MSSHAYADVVLWFRRRHARRVLERLSDADLADIGISRSEIDAAVVGRSMLRR